MNILSFSFKQAYNIMQIRGLYVRYATDIDISTSFRWKSIEKKNYFAAHPI